MWRTGHESEKREGRRNMVRAGAGIDVVVRRAVTTILPAGGGVRPRRFNDSLAWTPANSSLAQPLIIATWHAPRGRPGRARATARERRK